MYALFLLTSCINTESNTKTKVSVEETTVAETPKEAEKFDVQSADVMFYQDVEIDDMGLQREVYLTIDKDETIKGEYIDWQIYDIVEERFDSAGMENLKMKGTKTSLLCTLVWNRVLR